MTQFAFVTIPDDWDAQFVVETTAQAPILNYTPLGNGNARVGFPPAYADAVAAAVEQYPVAYRARVIPAKIAAIKAERDRRLQIFNYTLPDESVWPIPVDDKTEARLHGCLSMLERSPDVLTVFWSLGSGRILPLPRDIAIDIAVKFARNLNRHFTCFAGLIAQALAAGTVATLNALVEADDAHWSEAAAAAVTPEMIALAMAALEEMEATGA